MGGEIQVLLSWYVYQDGQQVWLLGQAALLDGQAEVSMSSYTGADFPPNFTTESVLSSPWGTITLRFTGPDAARVDWASAAQGYGSGGMDLVRLTQLAGHACEG